MDKETTPMMFTQDLYNEIQMKLNYLNDIVQEHKVSISSLEGKITALLSAKAELKLPNPPTFMGDCQCSYHGPQRRDGYCYADYYRLGKIKLSSATS
jgi:hypothetical protein